VTGGAVRRQCGRRWAVVGDLDGHVLRAVSNSHGAQITSLRPDPGLLAPTWSAVVLVGYAVVALGAAAWLITRRDA
jgi:hypothetical protein